MTSLLDMLKETDLRTDFSKAFKSATGREWRRQISGHGAHACLGSRVCRQSRHERNR
jgi:hypothetical protein